MTRDFDLSPLHGSGELEALSREAAMDGPFLAMGKVLLASPGNTLQ